MKAAFVDQIKAAMELENKEFSIQVRSEDAKEAFAAFLRNARLTSTGPGKLSPPHSRGRLRARRVKARSQRRMT